jgi:hypothetical protein
MTSDRDPSAAQTVLIACAAMVDLARPAERTVPLAGVRVPCGLSMEDMVMDAKRFDAIAQDLAATTSRRGMVKGVGLAAGGAALAGLLGLVGRDAADAAGRRRRRNRRRRDQCRKVGQTCNESVKRQSCCKSGQLCANVRELGSGNFCCKQVGSSCSTSSDCCGRDACDFSTGRCRTTQ